MVGKPLVLGAIKAESKRWDWYQGLIEDPWCTRLHPRTVRMRAKSAFLSSDWYCSFCVGHSRVVVVVLRIEIYQAKRQNPIESLSYAIAAVTFLLFELIEWVYLSELMYVMAHLRVVIFVSFFSSICLSLWWGMVAFRRSKATLTSCMRCLSLTQHVRYDQ